MKGRYHAHVLPGFWFHPTWLWQDEPPELLETLAEMRGLAPDAVQTLRDMLTGQPSKR